MATIEVSGMTAAELASLLQKAGVSIGFDSVASEFTGEDVYSRDYNGASFTVLGVEPQEERPDDNHYCDNCIPL